MLQPLLFTEMNQAVPGSSVSPRMEQHLECEVPSPSQWSDTCATPPSFHSPVHYPSEIEKVKESSSSPIFSLSSPSEVLNYLFSEAGPIKEEPYSPPSCFDYLMSKETSSNEASINLADLLADTGSFVAHIQYRPEPPPPVLPPLSPLENLRQREDEFDFLESLADVKKESEDESRFAVTSTTPAVTPAAPHLLVPSVVPTTVSSTGDGLRTVELMALHHCRQDVQRVSHKLNIPKDPTAWSLANVKSWLEFEADQHRLPSLNLTRWTYAGAELVALTETHFRELIPQGGEVLFAKLELWRLNIPSRSPPPPPPRTIQYQTLPPSPTQQPLSINVQPHHYYAVPQMYQSPTQVMSPPMFSPGSMLLSPVGSQQQLSPAPSGIAVPQQPASPTPPLPPPSQILPTPVIQAEQQLKRQNADRSKAALTKRRRTSSPAYPLATSSFLEESCVDMTTLLQQNNDGPKPPSPQPSSNASVAAAAVAAAVSNTTTAASTVESQREDADSDEEVSSEKPAPSTGGTGRGGTHIHLWQFLKELLQHPHKYAPCIRWLDRQAGIFKIEDSVRVAHLWGKRKNRPAMNYDKLSRSIRQYYKKGIMKKTERSQRLVYQFCHPYGL